MILDLDRPKHATADARLRAELIIWLTTVNPAGQPQSTPVWFLWDGEEFLIYGINGGPKTVNIAANPRVSLHLNDNGRGGDIVIVEGTARQETDGPAADTVPDYVAKYLGLISSYGWTPASFAADYADVIKVTPARARIW